MKVIEKGTNKKAKKKKFFVVKIIKIISLL